MDWLAIGAAVDLGKFVVGAGEADLESFDLADFKLGTEGRLLSDFAAFAEAAGAATITVDRPSSGPRSRRTVVRCGQRSG